MKSEDSSFVAPRYEAGRPGSRLLWTGTEVFHQPKAVDIHVYPGIEVGFVLQGVEESYYSDLRLTCGPGDAWLCSTWEPHGWQVSVPNTEVLVLIFTPHFLGEELLGSVPWLTLFAVPADQRPRPSTPQLRRKVLEIARLLREEVANRPAHWEAVVRLELLRLLIELSRGWEGGMPAASLGPARVATVARIMPALNQVHGRQWERVTVPEAAAACGLSLSQFRALFRRTMGLSFGAFCLRARLSFAAHQLLHTDRSVATIAAAAGFADDSHLYRHFVRQYGATPGQ